MRTGIYWRARVKEQNSVCYFAGFHGILEKKQIWSTINIWQEYNGQPLLMCRMVKWDKKPLPIYRSYSCTVYGIIISIFSFSIPLIVCTASILELNSIDLHIPIRSHKCYFPVLAPYRPLCLDLKRTLNTGRLSQVSSGSSNVSFLQSTMHD